MGANAPEMCRIVGSNYVLDITAEDGSWTNTPKSARLNKVKTFRLSAS